MAGLDVITQDDFSMGMVRSIDPESAPPVSLVDAVNTLYDDVGGTYRRGGTSYRGLTAMEPGSPITFMWDGWLANGKTTGVANASSGATMAGRGAVAVICGTGRAKPMRAVAMDGVLYLPGGATYNGTTIGAAAKTVDFYATVAGRLLAAKDDRIDFSD